jgi:hypothetical protein
MAFQHGVSFFHVREKENGRSANYSSLRTLLKLPILFLLAELQGKNSAGTALSLARTAWPVVAELLK